MRRRNFLMYAAVSFLALLTDPLLVSRARATPKIKFPLQTAKFIWDWEQGNSGAVEEFEIICGPLKTTIADPAVRSVFIKDVVPGPGIYKDIRFVARNRSGSTIAPTSFPPIQVSTASGLVTVLGLTA